MRKKKFGQAQNVRLFKTYVQLWRAQAENQRVIHAWRDTWKSIFIKNKLSLLIVK